MRRKDEARAVIKKIWPEAFATGPAMLFTPKSAQEQNMFREMAEQILSNSHENNDKYTATEVYDVMHARLREEEKLRQQAERDVARLRNDRNQQKRKYEEAVKEQASWEEEHKTELKALNDKIQEQRVKKNEVVERLNKWIGKYNQLKAEGAQMREDELQRLRGKIQALEEERPNVDDEDWLIANALVSRLDLWKAEKINEDNIKYMQHWSRRATRAEKQLKQVREELQALQRGGRREEEEESSDEEEERGTASEKLFQGALQKLMDENEALKIAARENATMLKQRRREAIRETKGAASNLIFNLLRQIVHPAVQSLEWKISRVGLLQDYVKIERFTICSDSPSSFDWNDPDNYASFATAIVDPGIDPPSQSYDDFPMLLLYSFGHYANHRLAQQGMLSLRQEVHMIEQKTLIPLLELGQQERIRSESLLTDFDHIRLSCLRTLLTQQLEDAKKDGFNYARIAAMIVRLFFTYRVSPVEVDRLVSGTSDNIPLSLLAASGLLRLRMLIRHLVAVRPHAFVDIIDLVDLNDEDDNAANGLEDLADEQETEPVVKQEGEESGLFVSPFAGGPSKEELQQARLDSCNFVDARFKKV